MSAPGTDEQKRMFEGCVRCHTIDRAFRSEYDAEDWLRVLERMDGYVTSAFPGNPQRRPQEQVDALRGTQRTAQEARRRQAEYLASINLSSENAATSSRPFPVPRGEPPR